ncbi:MAG: phytanoyl-CoA dioxygenase family protein [Caldilineaceae bacterium]|nr:phytanoyl-CoA dioxygenase family protein [Caldilineaceae bacterium]
MDIKTALYTLGVREETLSAGEKRSLDEDGFLPLPGILTPAQVQALRNRLQELEDEEGEDAGKEVHQEDGTDRLANLANKDPLFDQIWANPKVLAAMAHVLDGDLKLSSLNARAALPGHGLQALHCDGSHSSANFAPVLKEGRRRYNVCNSIWLLSDFTPDNGATRLVPGSHLFGVDPGEGMEDPRAPHPDEILVQGEAGTVFVFNAFTWHGGTVNRSDSPRRALHCYYCRRGLTPQTDQRGLLRPETSARISEAQRVVLGV